MEEPVALAYAHVLGRTLASAPTRMGRRLVASRQSPLARRNASTTRRAALPAYDPDLLSLPGQRARLGRAERAVPRRVRLRQRSSLRRARTRRRNSEPPPGIYQNRPADGLSRVVCFTPRHDLTLAELTHDAVRRAAERAPGRSIAELGGAAEVRHVLMFENKGEVVGVSNPHPHCQIYATNFVFRTIEIEADASAAHLAATGACCFEDIIAAEQDDGRRILASRDGAAVVRAVFRAVSLRDLRRAACDARQHRRAHADASSTTSRRCCARR